MSDTQVITLADLAALPYRAQGDLCLSFWAIAVRDGWIDFPKGATVLEIGCAEADWQTPMLALRPDLNIAGIDWRPCERPGLVVTGDVMEPDTFTPESFDVIVSISAIEHIGLSAYDGDPFHEDGDRIAMRNALRWLKPGGWMYLDVPYRPAGYVCHDQYRGYDDAALHNRLVRGFRVRHWSKCEVDHPDAPYMALLLEKPC